MSLLGAFAVYFVIWWTVLFCILPMNIRSQIETGEVVSGTEPGAPASPQLLRKAAITSLVSFGVFAVVYVLWVWTEF
jgi:predicted secreted protein